MSFRNKNQFILLALLFILATLASQTESRSLQTPSSYETHEQWMAIYGRVYKDSVEKEKRAKIFKANVEYIESFNKGNKPYKLGLNKFADLTNEEFKLQNRFKSHVCVTTQPLQINTPKEEEEASAIELVSHEYGEEDGEKARGE